MAGYPLSLAYSLELEAPSIRVAPSSLRPIMVRTGSTGSHAQRSLFHTLYSDAGRFLGSPRRSCPTSIKLTTHIYIFNHRHRYNQRHPDTLLPGLGDGVFSHRPVLMTSYALREISESMTEDSLSSMSSPQ